MPSNSSDEFKDNDSREDYRTQPTVGEEESRLPAGTLTDDERLRMLGYDVSLGRPLGFWSSAGLNVCHSSAIFDFIGYQAMYAYDGPLLFIIGYPFLAFFHLCLIGPFSELVSAFPVAGGMATWAWQLARNGVGGERQWAWVVAGFTLAMHLGKTISYMYAVTISLKSIYTSMAFPDSNQLTGEAAHPKEWWEPVFYLSLVSFVAILTMTRIARTSTFWIAAGIFNVIVIILTYSMLITCAVKIPTSPQAKLMDILGGNPPQNWGFPNRKKWIYPLSRMIFMGLPLRVTAIDAPIHMAEETQNPSRTVPRVLWTTCIYHYINVYILVILYIVFLIPVTNGLYATFPVVPLGGIMDIGKSGILAFAILATLCTTTQVLASTLITSRFIFALARDKGIPFSKFLARTDKHKEPWVAMTALLLAMFLATTGWLVNHQNWFSLLQAFQFYLINIPYGLPLVLYLLCRLDLRYVGRSDFSLGRLSKPCTCITIAWLSLSLIQGCLSLTVFNGKTIGAEAKDGQKASEIISFLPMVIAGLLLIFLASWFLYGRRHFVGPIRALTIWTTGQDIDPRNVSTTNPRGRAIRQYIDKKTGRTSSNEGSNPATPVRPTFSGPRTATLPSSPAKSPTLQRLLGRGTNSPSNGSPGPSTDWNTSTSPYGGPAVSVLPESGVLPHERTANYDMTRGGVSVIPESGVFPESVVDDRSMMSAAQAESQFLPEPQAAVSRARRGISFRPSTIKIGNQSYPLTQLTPPPRSPPTQTPLSPPPRGRNSLQYASALPTQIEAAMEESQLEPEPHSGLSFGAMPALEESQIHPGGSRDSFGVGDTLESRSGGNVVSIPSEEESFIEPAALAESQLHPSQ
ncbi:uncharacterized protein CcaverHIS019_0700960 [Cutaneotrichosporon cavernicola]|uniref:Amino acid permease/ SLC12A domain-containing protein n=1 Tax=Cutaneotrichosporon cavernicola TaxID=279322 RepID=A0AA48L9Q5_9TREE|nr:uncharacterized protein CcaverHIS019_0700960 [Cutaneotrichosporon cavernicola]BEI94524.1 hypothetical protein CcaverHIS019_0700960 [Cutaneotrichosporon cavernicola]